MEPSECHPPDDPNLERLSRHSEPKPALSRKRVDDEIGRATDELEHEVTGAEGRLVQAETRHAAVLARRERRREELGRQQAVTLQGVERLASALILPHPERETLDVRRLRPHPETEMTANTDRHGARGRAGLPSLRRSREELGLRRDQPGSAIGTATPDQRERTRRPDRQHPAPAERAPRRRRPARLLLAVRGHRLRNRTYTPGSDQRPGPVPVARGQQGRH